VLPGIEASCTMVSIVDLKLSTVVGFLKNLFAPCWYENSTSSFADEVVRMSKGIFLKGVIFISFKISWP